MKMVRLLFACMHRMQKRYRLQVQAVIFQMRKLHWSQMEGEDFVEQYLRCTGQCITISGLWMASVSVTRMQEYPMAVLHRLTRLRYRKTV